MPVRLSAVLTVRHAQQYGDMKLVEESFQYHVEWLEFLKAKWVVREWMKLAASEEPIYDKLGQEETAFLHQVNKEDLQELINFRIVEQSADGTIQWLWKRGSNMPEGILAVRYNLKALSEFGYQYIALDKAAGVGYPSYEYMMSHNATTLWEAWYRSETIFSRNHAMLGAVAEWLSSSVAGVGLIGKLSVAGISCFGLESPPRQITFSLQARFKGPREATHQLRGRFSMHMNRMSQMSTFEYL